MDELETLNMLLRLIGSSPVNSTNSDHPDVANAMATMNRTRQRAQRRGWWCNIGYNIQYQPDARGEIKIPSQISTFVTRTPNIVVRGNKLFDNAANTYKFAVPIVAERIVRILDWDDMPDVMQEYTAYLSATEFVRDELEDYSKIDSLNQSAMTSYLDLKKRELEEAQYNIFSTPRIRTARGGVRPYHRGGQGYFTGTPDK